MKRLLHIVLVVLMVLPFSCSRRGRIIPPETMEQIYFDLFVVDQIITQDSKTRRMADTMLVYEPIFEQYGYDTDDYNRSQAYYLQDPERHSKLIKRVITRLDQEKERVDAEISLQEWREKFAHIPFTPADSILLIRDDSVFVLMPAWQMVLSLDSLIRDSLRRDSLVRDSLLRDSLRLDSLRLDSLRLDSLRLDSLRQKNKPKVKR